VTVQRPFADMPCCVVGLQHMAWCVVAAIMSYQHWLGLD